MNKNIGVIFTAILSFLFMFQFVFADERGPMNQEVGIGVLIMLLGLIILAVFLIGRIIKKIRAKK